jgi:hypothetical protein
VARRFGGTLSASSRSICRSTERVLELLVALRARATFFVLGEVAGRFPPPYISLTRRTMWSVDVVRDAGFVYDSSAFPMLGRVGRIKLPLGPFRFGNGLVEIPVCCFRIGAFGFPASGGGYLRHLPWGGCARRSRRPPAPAGPRACTCIRTSSIRMGAGVGVDASARGEAPHAHGHVPRGRRDGTQVRARPARVEIPNGAGCRGRRGGKVVDAVCTRRLR